ncbi:TlpA family protein disulfide reductase [Alteribacter aurantiacus]|uniref:TlpA family protein disulfide reductase n=1 Tax=Alteribacter aurantiacus TaxID=254410 RepID=UPI00041E4F71|nr:TlpA disulfide reductase family protein [Alteribacter aurantiacus]
MGIKRFRQWPLVLTCLLLAGGAFWASESQHEWALSQRAMVAADEGVHEGNKIVNFRLPDKYGEEQELYDILGEQKTIVIFFTTWCEVCSEHWTNLKEMKEAGGLTDIQIVGVHLKDLDPDANLSEYFSGWESLPVFVDGDGTIKQEFEIVGMPTVYLVDENKQVHKRVLGMLTPDLMEADAFFSQ